MLPAEGLQSNLISRHPTPTSCALQPVPGSVQTPNLGNIRPTMVSLRFFCLRPKYFHPRCKSSSSSPPDLGVLQAALATATADRPPRPGPAPACCPNGWALKAAPEDEREHLYISLGESHFSGL